LRAWGDAPGCVDGLSASAESAIHLWPALRIRLIVTPEALYESGLMDDNSFRNNDQLKVNEITEDDRRVQMGLYEKLSASLRAAK
jgi:hypothetical protein